MLSTWVNAQHLGRGWGREMGNTWGQGAGSSQLLAGSRELLQAWLGKSNSGDLGGGSLVAAHFWGCGWLCSALVGARLLEFVKGQQQGLVQRL